MRSARWHSGATRGLIWVELYPPRGRAFSGKDAAARSQDLTPPFKRVQTDRLKPKKLSFRCMLLASATEQEMGHR